MSQSLFISGTGTGVGKTFVTCSLAYQLLNADKRISAVKPIASGYKDNDADSDTARILASQGLKPTRPNVDAVTPWRFEAALAPSIAAEKEGKHLEIPELTRFCNMSRVSEVVLIEGIGGVMTPISDTHTVLDWMADIGAPVILVTGTYLGSLSHILTAAEAVRAKGLSIQAVVVSESGEAAMSAAETASLLKPFLPYVKYIVPLPYVAGGRELWQHTADLTWMLT